MFRHAIRGFVLLELLVVLVVIAILAGGYFANQGSPTKEGSLYQTSMSRSNDAACKANRATLLGMIQMFKINNPSLPANTENLQKAGYNPPTCPQGGSYGFTAEGKIICTKHPDKP